MDNEPFTLSKRVDIDILNALNGIDLASDKDSYRIFTSLDMLYDDGELSVDLNEISNWIAAIKSGKHIVNPIPPEEEFRKLRSEMLDKEIDVVMDYVDPLMRIIAKEYPKVKKWIDE